MSSSSPPQPESSLTLKSEEFVNTNLNLLPKLNQTVSISTMASENLCQALTTTTTITSNLTTPTTTLVQTPATSTTTTKFAHKKITVLFKAVGSAPILRQKFFEVEPTRTIAAICLFLRKILHVSLADSLFVYVNSSFSPTPEHTIEQLCECFGNSTENKLTLQYSLVQAWG